jgi:hypothetical protein
MKPNILNGIKFFTKIMPFMRMCGKYGADRQAIVDKVAHVLNILDN